MLYWVIAAVGVAVLIASLVFDDFIEALDFGPEWLSGTVVGGFAAAFGFAGGIAVSLGATSLVAGTAALAAGLGLGAGAGALTRSMAGASSGAAFTDSDLVGLSGVVVSDIPPAAAGHVSIPVHGIPTKLAARSSEALAVGTPVVVVSVTSATSVVVRPA